MAMHRASPTSINPSRSAPLSGRKAQARPSYSKSTPIQQESEDRAQHTITSGAIIQFTTTLNKICTHISLFPNTLCKLSYLTLQRIGYIITSNPTATKNISIPPPLSLRKRGHTNRHTHPHKLPLLQRRPRIRHKIPQNNPHRHRQKDP
jgi:hypothetical protein